MIGKYFVLFITIGAAAAIQQVPVSIYYETLCADSMAFFTKQFVPTWRQLKDYINLELVPYGKSTVKAGPPNVVFECHHGDNECLGNKFQSCLLKGTYERNLENQINLINCLMTDATKDVMYNITTMKCKKATPTVDVTLLNTCASSTEGDNLLLANKEKSDRIQNPLSFVPTIVFNNKFNSAESKEAEKLFRSTLCKYITVTPKPDACLASGATITTLGMITLLSAGLVIRML